MVWLITPTGFFSTDPEEDWFCQVLSKKVGLFSLPVYDGCGTANPDGGDYADK